MDDAIRRALGCDRTIDITTVGRTSGQPRRIETWFYRSGGQIYLTGSPGRRDWYANLVATPAFTFHLKESATADLPARATAITNPEARRAILAGIREMGEGWDLEAWVAGSPLVAVAFTDQDEAPTTSAGTGSG